MRDFVPDDLQLLQSFLGQYPRVIITAHVATEASHFLSKLERSLGRRLKGQFVTALSLLIERPVKSRSAGARPEFEWLDLADCSLLEAAKPDDVLLSTDAQLVNRRLELGLEAVNFNHLREQAGLV